MLKTTEYLECLAFTKWCQYHPIVRSHLIHIPNEGLRHPRTGKRLRSIGMSAGVPDYFICVPKGKFGGLFLEMKKPGMENRAKNPNQEAWIARLLQAGYFASYAYGAKNAISLVESYLDGRL